VRLQRPERGPSPSSHARRGACRRVAVRVELS
jgi:hypothetical protein